MWSMVNAINQDIPRNITIGIQIAWTTNLRNKKELVMNGISTQLGGTWIKSNNKRSHIEANKFGSIICYCFIYNSIKHKIYDFPHKDAVQTMFKEKAMITTAKKDSVAINMVLVVTTHM